MSSYLLERELLGSARNIIDAHSNGPLVSNNYRGSYGTSSSPTTVQHHYQETNGNYEAKKIAADLQDQVRLLKRDLEKKDGLIQELSSMRDVNKHTQFETSKYEAMVGAERNALENARRELAQMQTRVESATHDLRECTLKLSAKDEHINELRHEVESIKKEYDIMNNANNQLKIRVRELEGNVGSYESVTNKSSVTITALQHEIKEKQEQLLELQSRIRTHMEERETSERKTEGLNKKLHELFSQLNIIFGADCGVPTPAALENLKTKISDINAENTSLKGRLVKLEEKNRSLENESSANRSTIQQMVNQLQNYEQNGVGSRLQIDTLKGERDAALSNKESIQRELETMKSRLESVQKAWQNTKQELDTREEKFLANELNLKQLDNDALYAKTCLDSFKQQVGQLLSDGYVKVEPKEDEIKEKIQLLMQSSKDRGVIITNLQNQKEHLSKQLQEQIELNKEADSKRHHAEQHLLELEHRLKTLDNDYTTTEVYRENLKHDKAKFLHFIERLASVMKIQNVSHDIGYELNPDVILTRAEQLMKLENDSIVDQKTNIYSLQRKIKQLKEQIENKDLHLDLLRKKVIALEEGRNSKSDLEKEIDDHVMLSRKMKVKVDNLTQQVNELKHENTQLKAQMTDIHMLKSRIMEHEKEIRRLLEDNSKLQNVRDKQAVKISNLQDKMHNVDEETNRTLLSSDNAVRSLSNELRFLKSSLEQVTERERRLLDFRGLVARMLGLDAKTLSVPDYEITARLERLLTVVQPTIAMPVVHIPQQQHQQQRQEQHHYYPSSHNYNNQRHTAHTRTRSPSPPTRRHETSHRARSHSPSHMGIDPRTY